MGELTRPDREPDFYVHWSGTRYPFWIEERLYMEFGVSKFDIKNDHIVNSEGIKFIEVVQEAYQTWVVERELLDI